MEYLQDWVPKIGSLCWGIVIIYITLMFLRKISPEKFTFDGYKIVVSVLGGAGIQIIAVLISDNVDAFWFYPIGLFVGFVIYVVVAVVFFGEPPDKVAYGRVTEKKKKNK